MNYKKKLYLSTVLVIVLGLLLPESLRIPVQGATKRDWNPRSFWYEPWGKSGVHKGIDIFAPAGTPVVASTPGVVMYAGTLGIGGNVIAILGPKWRIHYYAHLTESRVSILTPVGRGRVIGTVGTSGNAAGKPAHLHYSVLALIPMPWRMADVTQGWKRMFFLDPNELIGAATD